MIRSVSRALLVTLAVAACADPATTPRVATPDAPRPDVGVDALVAIPLGDLGGGTSTAYQLTDARLVVGSSTTATGETHAFVWTPATGMRDLGAATGDAYSEALGVNRRGQIVGVSGTRAVRWDVDGHAELLPLPPDGTASRATAIDDGGTIVGLVVVPGFPFPRTPVPAIWSPREDGGVRVVLPPPVPSPFGGSGVTTAGEAVAIAENGRIAATIGMDLGHGTFAATWREQDGWRVPDSLTTVDTRAYDLNARGDMVGVDLRHYSYPLPVLWHPDGTRVVLAAVGEARGINDAGQIVGSAGLQQYDVPRAVVWDAQGRMEFLAHPYATLRAISNDGDVVGDSGRIATLWTRHPNLIAAAGAVTR